MNTTEPIQCLTESHRDKLYQLIAAMNISNLYLVNKIEGGTGMQINISHYSPTLTLIFKTMLLTAIDGRCQTLTVEFDDCTAVTHLNHSKRLENQK